MEFQYLDDESEQLLKDLLSKNTISNLNCKGSAVSHLISNGYVTGLDSRNISDIEPTYVLTGITQKGKSYFELKTKHEKTEKQMSRREWWIAIIGALIGAIVSNIPDLIELVSKLIK